MNLLKSKNYKTKLLLLEIFLKDKKINFNDLRIENKKIIFSLSKDNTELVKTFFLDKESEINPYYNQYKSHQFDVDNAG